MNWIKVDPNNLPDAKQGPFLVTNNISARNSHGRMSHVWLAQTLYQRDDSKGPVSAFADLDQEITSITHYAIIEVPDESADPVVEGLAKENPVERKMFNRQVEQRGGTLTYISQCLHDWALGAPQGSYRECLVIMSNEARKIAVRLSEPGQRE